MARKVKKPKARMGRPPRPDSGNYVHVGFGLRTDLRIYAGSKARLESRSMASALNDLVQKGVEVDIRERKDREVREIRLDAEADARARVNIPDEASHVDPPV